MYNGIGLQTSRGSGTNGYVQTNKFLIKSKTSKVVVDGNKGFGPDQGTAGISKKPNKDIPEHDRKRRIELKLVILEDKLVDQGYTDAEIAECRVFDDTSFTEKLREARMKLEAADAASDQAVFSDEKVSDTQTHQIAARKEKQMEKLRAALGITNPDVDAENQDKLDETVKDYGNGEKPRNIRKDNSDDSEHEEGEILYGDRDMMTEKHYQDEGKTKNQEGRKSRQEDRRKRHGSESSDSESDSGSESDSEHETKRKPRSNKKMSKRSVSDDSNDSASETDSDGSYRSRKEAGRLSNARKRHDSGSESDYRISSPDYRTKKSKHNMRKSRHDSEDEYDVGASKRGTGADRQQALARSHERKNTDNDSGDSDRKHNRFHKCSDKLHYDDGSYSDLETKLEKRVPERRQRSRSYDKDDDDYGLDHIGRGSGGRWRHDSEDDDSDIETLPSGCAKEKEENDCKWRRRDEKMEDDHDKRKKEVEKKNDHERRRRERDYEDRHSHERRKRERRKEDVEPRQKLERREEDTCTSGVREREESELGNSRFDGSDDDDQGDRKRKRREEDEKADRRRERRDDDDLGYRRQKRRDEDEKVYRRHEDDKLDRRQAER